MTCNRPGRVRVKTHVRQKPLPQNPTYDITPYDKSRSPMFIKTCSDFYRWRSYDDKTDIVASLLNRVFEIKQCMSLGEKDWWSVNAVCRLLGKCEDLRTEKRVGASRVEWQQTASRNTTKTHIAAQAGVATDGAVQQLVIRRVLRGFRLLPGMYMMPRYPIKIGQIACECVRRGMVACCSWLGSTINWNSHADW